MATLTLKQDKAASGKQTLEQRRATHAWAKAKAGIAQHQKDYVNDAKGLPALIMNSGLMQVMAFLHGKGGRHEVLASHLRDWLQQAQGTPRDFEAFMQHLLNAQPTEFQAITAEAFAWLRWLRQMAPAAAREV
ncbi:MAG: type III-B CRISPR module-associated protein Cmr5 [Gammaproteobacteria bacterium SHHR-1]